MPGDKHEKFRALNYAARKWYSVQNDLTINSKNVACLIYETRTNKYASKELKGGVVG